MKPDEQWKGGDGSLAAAYRIMTCRDAKHRGDSAGAVLLNLASTIDAMPQFSPGEKAALFDAWLEALHHVYGPKATRRALALLQKGGRNGHA